MTTDAENFEATAEEQQADATANLVEAAVAEITQEETTVEEPLTADDLRREIGSLQGAIASRTGADRKAMDSRLSRLETAIGDMANASYEQRLAEMTYEERDDFLRAENERLRTPSVPQQQQQEVWLTAEEQNVMAAYTDATIQSNGLSLNRGDPKLWQGAYEGMPVNQLQELVQKNAKALSQPAPPPVNTRTQQTNSEEPPPTMQGAASVTVMDYPDRSSVARAMMDGDLGSDDVRRIYAEKGW